MKRPLLTLAFVAALPCMVAAHHILGLPHYKYGDQYPQIPYLEVIAQVGSTDLDFTYFPGIPQPGQAVRFKLYIHDRDTGEVFRDPLQAEVVRTTFLEGDTVVAEPFEIRTGLGPERNDYKFFLTFEQAEAYEVRLAFPNGDGIEVIPFPVVIGETDDRPLIFGAAGILAMTVISVAVIKRRRKPTHRRSAPAPRAR